MTTIHSHPQPPTPTRPLARRPLPAAPRLNQPATLQTTPWLVLIFLVSLLQPSLTSFFIGDFRLTIYRVILLCTVIPCLLKLFSNQVGRPRPVDYLVIFHALWIPVALTMVHDLGVGLKTGGIYFVEAVGAYLLGRCYIRNAKSFTSVALLLCTLVLLLAIETVPEAITGTHFLRPGEGSLGRRFGLERAFGPFEHPILLGVFCASSVGLSWFVLAQDHRLRPMKILRTIMICVSAIMSVSSGAVAAIMSQFVLIGWDLVTRNRKHRWWILLSLFALAYVAVALYSNRTPMTVALYYLTFNAETAYGRIIIWDCGTAEVGRHPLFGVGNNSWEHPTYISDSIDNFWLATAMMFGLPAIITLAGAFIYVLVGAMRLKTNNPLIHRQRLGWITCVTGLSVAAFTVHFWNSLFVIHFFILGCGVWLLDAGAKPSLKKSAAKSRPAPGLPRAAPGAPLP